MGIVSIPTSFNLYIIDIYKPVKNNGLSMYVAQLVAFLKQKQNISFHFIWLNNIRVKTIACYQEDGAEHIHISHEYSSLKTGVHPALLPFLKAHSKDKQNIIFHFNWINHSALAWEIKRHIVCKTILTKHCIPWRDSVTGNYSLFLRLNRCFDKGIKPPHSSVLDYEEKAYHSIDHIIALTRCAEKSLTQFFDVSQQKITLIPNGIEARQIKPGYKGDKQKLRQKYGFGNDDRLIIYAGNINPRKGIIDVVHIFQNFIRENKITGVKLLIAGPGNHQLLLSSIKSHWNNIILLGSLDKNTLYDFYAMADIGIIPSYVEQCSYTCIEMMHSKLALMVANVDGLKEMVNDDCGLKINITIGKTRAQVDSQDFKNKLLYLLNYPNKAKRLGENARKYALKHFSSERMGKQTLAIYRQLFQPKNVRLFNAPLDEITIVIPTFNSSVYLRDTLNALIAQTYGKWYCLLIDDGSTDNTVEIIKQFTGRDQRIEMLAKDGVVKGANSSRNIGLNAATTTYVMFVDADDILLPSCIEERLSSLQENADKDMLVFKTAFMDADTNITGYFPCVSKPQEQLIADFVDHRIQWQTMSVLWKRKFLIKIGGWDECFERLQDVELNIRALLNHPQICFVNKPFDSKYRHLPPTTLKKTATLYGFTRLISKYYRELTQHETFAVAQRDYFKNSFTKLIYRIGKNYVSREYVDLKWAELFLSTLRQIEFDEEKYQKIVLILDEYHRQQVEI